jgi:alkylation response protein AidB-like acyl-CoA dehydrogenase
MSTVFESPVQPMQTLSDPILRAQSLCSLIKSEAENTNKLGQIAEPVINAFRETELFWMCVPAELGGEDISMKKRFEVYEEVASYDGSTGWSFMTLSGFVGYTSVGLGDSAVQALYGDRNNRALVAGFAGPTGTAVPTDGGYQLTGTYRFGSGAPHASYLAAGAFVEGTDGDIVTAFVPSAETNPQGGWDVIGLKGSGSIDYSVPDSYVPADYTFSPVNYIPLRGGAGGRMDFSSTAVTYHTAVALGIAKHALQEVVRIADGGKQRPPADKVIDQQRFNHDFAFNEARLAAVRALMIENIENARVKIESGEDMNEFDCARFRQAANLAHNVALEVAQFAFYWSGTESVRNGSVLGRCLLDLQVALMHVHIDHNSVVAAAPTVINHYRNG